ncbi:MAG: KH domain-containing protein [Candidatus Eisenbacteria bacterium]|nr:KH domain-containing protein [Candidatus Eisenbacteria bacterium]
MKGLIEFIAKSLVDRPDEVAVTEVPGERATVYELRVAPDDLGKIIGKNGRTARSMRIALSAASTKAGGKRAVLEIKS